MTPQKEHNQPTVVEGWDKLPKRIEPLPGQVGLFEYQPRARSRQKQKGWLWWLPFASFSGFCQAQGVSFCIPQKQVSVNCHCIGFA